MLNKSASLFWNGEEYNLLIKYKTIRKFYERANIGLLALQIGDPQLYSEINHTDIAGIVAIALKEAGADVTEEEVYCGIFGGVDDIDINKIISMLSLILAACFPDVKKKLIVSKKNQKSSN